MKVGVYYCVNRPPEYLRSQSDRLKIFLCIEAINLHCVSNIFKRTNYLLPKLAVHIFFPLHLPIVLHRIYFIVPIKYSAAKCRIIVIMNFSVITHDKISSLLFLPSPLLYPSHTMQTENTKKDRQDQSEANLQSNVAISMQMYPCSHSPFFPVPPITPIKL